MRYAGLTDEAARRKQERGNPSDFKVMQQFTSETAARQWERRMLAQGCEEDTSRQMLEIWLYLLNTKVVYGLLRLAN